MAEPEPLGNLLDTLGVTRRPQDGELVAGAVVLLKLVHEDGTVTMSHHTSDGMAWIEKVGMLRTAERVVLDDLGHRDEQ